MPHLEITDYEPRVRLGPVGATITFPNEETCPTIALATRSDLSTLLQNLRFIICNSGFDLGSLIEDDMYHYTTGFDCFIKGGGITSLQMKLPVLLTLAQEIESVLSK
jgi:hypothetical protein